MFDAILIIGIDKAAPIQNVTQGCIDRIKVTDAVAYDRNNAAIADQALLISDGFAHFVQFAYGGISTETLLPHEVASRAPALAIRLVYLQAVPHERKQLQG